MYLFKRIASDFNGFETLFWIDLAGRGALFGASAPLCSALPRVSFFGD